MNTFAWHFVLLLTAALISADWVLQTLLWLLFFCEQTARLFHQAFISFRKYVLEMSALPADLHIILSDICCNAGRPPSTLFTLKTSITFIALCLFIFSPPGHIDDIYPYFIRHARQIFPMLDCMDDLRKISDLRVPANWYKMSYYSTHQNSVLCRHIL